MKSWLLYSEEVRWKYYESTNEILITSRRFKEKVKKREIVDPNLEETQVSCKVQGKMLELWKKLSFQKILQEKKKEITIMRISLKNILRNMVGIPFLQLGQPMETIFHV